MVKGIIGTISMFAGTIANYIYEVALSWILVNEKENKSPELVSIQGHFHHF